jgi:hypothetical protein
VWRIEGGATHLSDYLVTRVVELVVHADDQSAWGWRSTYPRRQLRGPRRFRGAGQGPVGGQRCPPGFRPTRAGRSRGAARPVGAWGRCFHGP